ncbi:MAG: hypothetical protein EP343_13095 [Deltaproteobacteria bacterium]|nr:MAG: hypothetical protein EP343_13095 [Deltaproteobacteria bacterium]
MIGQARDLRCLLGFWVWFGAFLGTSLCWTSSMAAPAARKSKKRKTKGKKVRLPPNPMLQSLPRFRKLSILRKGALRKLKMPPRKKPQLGPQKGKRQRLPTRPPKAVKPIRLVLPGVRGGDTPKQTRQRRGAQVKQEWSKRKGSGVRLVVRKLQMGRGGLMRRWSGMIVLRSNQLLFYCPLRMFCKTLRQQTGVILHKGLRWKGRRLAPGSPRFPWMLRRALERTYGYAVVLRSLPD